MPKWKGVTYVITQKGSRKTGYRLVKFTNVTQDNKSNPATGSTKNSKLPLPTGFKAVHATIPGINDIVSGDWSYYPHVTFVPILSSRRNKHFFFNHNFQAKNSRGGVPGTMSAEETAWFNKVTQFVKKQYNYLAKATTY